MYITVPTADDDSEDAEPDEVICIDSGEDEDAGQAAAVDVDDSDEDMGDGDDDRDDDYNMEE